MKYIGYILFHTNVGVEEMPIPSYIDYTLAQEDGVEFNVLTLTTAAMCAFPISDFYPKEGYTIEDFAGKLTGKTNIVRTKVWKKQYLDKEHPKLSTLDVNRKYMIKVYDLEDDEEWAGKKASEWKKKFLMNIEEHNEIIREFAANERDPVWRRRDKLVREKMRKKMLERQMKQKEE